MIEIVINIWNYLCSSFGNSINIMLITIVITSIYYYLSKKIIKLFGKYYNKKRLIALDTSLKFSSPNHHINPYIVLLSSFFFDLVTLVSILIILSFVLQSIYSYCKFEVWVFNSWWLLLLLVTVFTYLLPKWIESRRIYTKNRLSIVRTFPYISVKGYNRRVATKGLVGVLSTDVSSVALIDLPEDKGDSASIRFATEGSYESRKPITDRLCIEKIRQEKIVKYYNNLKNKIQEKFGSKNNLFLISETIEGQIKETHICDYMLEMFSLNNICNAIKKVEEKRGKDNTIQFIGDKIGVWDYSIINGELKLMVYQTDHFTFHVFKEICLSENYKETFQDIIRRVNLATELEKHYLVRCLKFVFSSFGVDVTISGYTADDKHSMLVSIRSSKMQKEKESLLHVPVNESFSRTDIINDCNYSLEECVIRGIEEELGVPENVMCPQGDNSKMIKIQFFDFAIVCDRGEIGLGCHVDFSDVMPLEQIRLYPGQDKYLEADDVLIVPYPRFTFNHFNYIKNIYKSTYDDRLCFSWVSFSTMLFQRSVMRNTQMSILQNLSLKGINSILLSFFTTYFAQGSLVAISKVSITTINFFVDVSLFVFIYILLERFFKPCKYRFSLLMPFIPQWNGNVRVIQATREIGEGSIAKGILFGIENKSRRTKMTCNLDELALRNEPYCKVRREQASNKYNTKSVECPISFYHLFPIQNPPQIGNPIYSTIEFRHIPFTIYYEDMVYKMDLYMDMVIYKGKPSFHFTRNVPIKLTFKEFSKLEMYLDENRKESDSELLKYYNISDDKNYLFAELDKSFQEQYKPLDLFYFKNKYYWSVKPKDLGIQQTDESYKIEKKSNPTDFYLKCIKEKIENKANEYKESVINGEEDQTKYFYTIKLTGKVTDMERFLSSFTQRVDDNRRRMNSLDIYMLQLAFIREKNAEKKDNFVYAYTEYPTWRMKTGKKIYDFLRMCNLKFITCLKSNQHDVSN